MSGGESYANSAQVKLVESRLAGRQSEKITPRTKAQRELRDGMPYVEDGPDGPRWTTKSGINMG
jgi:hypothetical protein